MAVKPRSLFPCLTKGALALIREGVAKSDKQLLAQGIALLEAINMREQRALVAELANAPAARLIPRRKLRIDPIEVDEDRLGRGIEPETEY